MHVREPLSLWCVCIQKWLRNSLAYKEMVNTSSPIQHTPSFLFFFSILFPSSFFFGVVHSVSTMSTIADINQSMKSPASSEHNTINEGILYIELLFVFLFSVGHHENLRLNPRRDPKPLLDYLFDDSSSLYWIIYRYVYTKYTCGLWMYI